MNIEKQLKHARPSLRLVSPASYWFVMLMGFFNIVLGVGFMTALRGTDDPTLNIVNMFLPFEAWGAIFFALGLVKLYSLVANNWKLSRYSLLSGVALKSVWAIALIIKTTTQADNIFLTITWITVALAQVICYIYFMPPLIGLAKKETQ